jgi:hypothetical protein
MASSRTMCLTEKSIRYVVSWTAMATTAVWSSENTAEIPRYKVWTEHQVSQMLLWYVKQMWRLSSMTMGRPKDSTGSNELKWGHRVVVKLLRRDLREDRLDAGVPLVHLFGWDRGSSQKGATAAKTSGEPQGQRRAKQRALLVSRTVKAGPKCPSFSTSVLI